MNKLPEIRLLNPNTYFTVTEINDNYQTPSALHVIYGDKDDTGSSSSSLLLLTIISLTSLTLLIIIIISLESEILVKGLTAEDMEHQIKAAVEVTSLYITITTIIIIIILVWIKFNKAST